MCFLTFVSNKKIDMNKNERIVGYKIISANSSEKLEELVRESIENGYYQPFGGVAVSITSEKSLIFVQALVSIS